ncbi:MAG: hypothetical protein IJD06_11535 [Clostridia bacterium]|nr:hypothetical protein [Clostridia bacterium]
MKRVLALMLALLMFGGALASCGETSQDPMNTGAADTAGNTETTPAVEETTADPGPQLEIPESDFEGHTVMYLTVTDYDKNFNICIKEQSGETLNEAGYKRELAVSEQLKVGFDSYQVAAADVAKTLASAIQAGVTDYDIVLPHGSNGVAAIVTNGSLLDWNSLNYVDFSKPWWNSAMQESLSIGDKLLYASGDLVITWQGTQSILFNKEYLVGDKAKENLYQLVLDGKWTMDKMMDLAKDVAQDLDGDSKMGPEDRFGLLLPANNANVRSFVYGFGELGAVKDENGCPVLGYKSDRMATVVDKLYAVTHSADAYYDSYSSANYHESNYRAILDSGRSFLTMLDIGGLYNYLRDIEFEFGILPLPKLDENQDQYYTFCGAGIIGLPVNTVNPDRSAIVMEALQYYSYEYVRPAFFDIVLQNKALRDKESYEMLNIIQNTKIFDVGFHMDTSGKGGVSALYKIIVTDNSTNYASYLASIEEAVNNGYKKLYDKVMGSAN